MEAAMVSASTGAMGSLLGKLGDLLTAKYKLLQESKGQIMFLKAELESMHVFLKKISDTEEPDDQDKCWAKEVRELSYDIEDSVSEFMLHVERDSSNPRGFKGFIDRCIRLLTTMNVRHDIAKEFEGLKIRVKKALSSKNCLQLDISSISSPTYSINHIGLGKKWVLTSMDHKKTGFVSSDRRYMGKKGGTPITGCGWPKMEKC